MDWTYDLYLEDLKKYGDNEGDSADNYNDYFISHIKSAAAKFLDDWKKQHNGKLYDHGWAGDEFARGMMGWFSDFYKDTYGQRPHLPTWYYVHPLGLPMSEDTARLFCANPIEDAATAAKEARELWND